jgi:hypothetical protein
VDRLVHDAALPGALPRPAVRSRERQGVFYSAAEWTPAALARLVDHLASAGSAALAALPAGALRDAWRGAIAALLDPASRERRALETSLPRLSGLSPAGTAAALRTVLGGVAGAAADAIFDNARGRGGGGLVTVVLASNLPALVVQPLLPALALGRPVLVKSASAEPLFAPALVRALVEREPRLADALAAITWPGGDREVEAPVLARSATVVAYGDAATLDDLRGRVAGRLVAYGPKTSLAIVSAEVHPERVARELARDVTLFDQRGCLSPQAVYTTGTAEVLAVALARELAAAERELPPGPMRAEELAAVQQLRAEADLRALFRPALPPQTGTVVVEPLPAFRPGPGLRTVRVHPVATLEEVPRHLEAWRGRLQGAALAGRAWELVDALRELGLTRCAAPGALQAPDASWHNGGLHPVELLAPSS